MNAPHRDDALWEAIESKQLDQQTRTSDPELADAFDAHQRLESLFDLLRCRASLNRDTPRLATGDTEPTDVLLTRTVLPESFGRYRVRSVLGTGGFGTVYLAEDPELRREVAIKIPRAGLFASQQAADTFLAEARSTAKLKHSGIVTVHDVGRDNGNIYLVLEYVPGRPLDDLMSDGRMEPAFAAGLIAEVADALHHAHTLGFVHRDLKPGNILVDGKNKPHVTDFGLAVSEDTQRKLAGQVAGTPAYMSPEQVRGETHRMDGRTDIWSLGVIFYEMLTGRQPFWRGDVKECFDEISNREPRPPRQIDDRIPPELEQICLKCLSKSVTERYTSAADVRRTLLDWLRHHDGQTAPTGLMWHGSRRWVIVSASLALLAMVAGYLFINHTSPSHRAPLPPGAPPEVQSLLGMLYTAKLGDASPAARIEPQVRFAGSEPDAWQPLRNGAALSSKDSYRVMVKPEQAGYLYIVQIDSSGKVEWLFPKNATSPQSSGENPVTPDDWTLVPQGDRAFYLDESLGTEHLYVVATASRWVALEESLEKISGVSSGGATISSPFGLKTRGVGGTRPADGGGSSPLIKGIAGALVEEVSFNHKAP